ncbi:MAG: helix-turn-helix domain-containing protein [Acidimicrobiia bacterium]|nr:helix-turn-helix domain-containing protein [Acidimicrobiia bacterium]
MTEPISAQARSLDRTIGDLTSALGDPTRRAIFIAVRESPEPATTASIAELFEIHPNVARHHLDKLAHDGYLRVTRRRPSGRSGPGAGRPAKCYEATGKGVELHFPSRRYDLLIDLLLRTLQRLDHEDIGSVAEAIGHEYGRELAEEIGSPQDTGYEEAVKAVASAMTGLGFDIAPDATGTKLLTSHCPFGTAATGHPDVVCSLDRGMVSGLFAALRQPCDPVVHPHHGDEDCVTEVPVSISRR